MITSVAHKASRMARCLWSIGLSLLAGLLLPSVGLAHQIIRHELQVGLQPDHHTLQVTDSITLPETLHPSDAQLKYFALHAGLSPSLSLLASSLSASPLQHRLCLKAVTRVRANHACRWSAMRSCSLLARGRLCCSTRVLSGMPRRSRARRMPGACQRSRACLPLRVST